MIEIIIFLFIASFIIQGIIGFKTHGLLLNPILIFNFIFFLHNWSFSFFQLFEKRILWGAPLNVTDKFQDVVLINNLVSLWAFFIGYYIFYSKKNTIVVKKTFDLKFYGKIYFLLSILFLIYGVVTNQFSAIYGEGQALTSSEAFNPISLIFSSRIIFGSIYLINRSEKAKKYFWLIILLEIFISVITGGRKAFVILLMSGLLVKYEKIKININQAIRFFFFSIVVIFFISFMSIYRGLSGGNLSFEKKVELTNKLILEDSVLFLYYSVGSVNSEGVQNWTYELIKDGGLKLTYGLTYIQSIVNTIIIRPFQGDLVNYQAAYYFKSVAYPDIDNHGWDFSFMAESLLNFGSFCFIPSLILGMIISYSFNKRLENEYYNILYILIISLLYINMRTDSTSFFRFLSFYVLSFYFFKKVLWIKENTNKFKL